MNQFRIAAELVASGLAATEPANATHARMIGTWTLVSSDTVSPDGSRVPTFAGKATGILIFSGDGRFSYLFSRADLPKFASNNRNTGTPVENAAVV